MKLSVTVVILSFVGFAFAILPTPECIRGAPPSMKDPFMDCCKVQIFPSDLIQKCKSANPQPMGQIKGCCTAECVLNETRIIAANGSLNKQTAITYLNQQMGSNDDESKKVVSDAVEFCSTQGAQMKNDFDLLLKSVAPGERACNLSSGYFVACVSSHIYKNCPKARYTTADAECEKIKSYAEKCNMLWPKKQMI